MPRAAVWVTKWIGLSEMRLDQRTSSAVIKRPILLKPVQMIVTNSVGDAVKVIAKGLNTNHSSLCRIEKYRGSGLFHAELSSCPEEPAASTDVTRSSEKPARFVKGPFSGSKSGPVGDFSTHPFCSIEITANTRSLRSDRNRMSPPV